MSGPSDAPVAGPSTPSGSTSSLSIKGASGASSGTTTTSLRKQLARRIRSPEPEPGPSSTTFSTPLPKKARTNNSSLLSRIGDAQETPATTAHSVGLPDSLATPGVTPGGSAAVGFEAQEDFISFEASPPPASAGRRSAKKRGREVEDVAGSNRMKDRESGRSTPWCDVVDFESCSNGIEMLNREAHAYIDYISPTPSEHELRLLTVELIRRTVKARWKDAEVECFGSVGTGLYLPGGDIDLVLLSPSLPSPPLKPSSSLLHQIASLLLRSELAVPSSLIVIAKARVPIVKFVTRWGGFSVDMSVNQKNGVEAAVRVRKMLEEHSFRPLGWREPGHAAAGSKKGDTVGPPIGAPQADHGVARALVLLVKSFLAQRGMNEVFTGGLGSYAIICLVISFLQLHPNIQSGQIHPHYNLGLLFVEFVELYGRHFNYDITGISLRGRGGYFNKHDKGWYRGNQPYLLSIEDPNDPSNDVSGGSHNIIRVRQTLAGAFDSLTATLYQRNSQFAARAADSQTHALSRSALPNADDDKDDPLQQSILGSVIGMSAAGVAAREDNVRLFEAGILQKLIRQSDPAGESLDGAALSKKAKKRARKEAEEKAKRERTAAKLEMRAEEKREKDLRKKAKKDRLEESLAPRKSASGSSTPIVGTQAESGVVQVVEAAEPFGATGQAAADFVGLNFDETEDESEEEHSRYAVQRKRKPSRSPQPPSARNVTYVRGSDDSSASDSQRSSDDDDVVIGGTGGSMVRTRSASLQPPSRFSRTAKTEAAAETGRNGYKLDQLPPVPPSAEVKKAEARKAKNAKRLERKLLQKEKQANAKDNTPVQAQNSGAVHAHAERLSEAQERARLMLEEARKRGERERSEKSRTKAEFWKAKGGKTGAGAMEVMTIDSD